MRHTNLDRLGIDTIREVICGEVRTRVREHAELQLRTPGDSDEYRTLTGYPAVFDQETVLYEGKRFVVKEKIAHNAFSDCLSDDCHLNYVHESASAMARNGISGVGGMELSQDHHGLRVYSQLPVDDVDVQRLVPKMERKVVDQMSFKFRLEDEELHRFTDENDREVYLYTVKKVARLYDVCVAPLGAYPTTEAALRSALAAQASGRAPISDDGAGRESLEGRAPGAGSEGGEGRSEEGSRTRALLLAEAQAAELTFRTRKES